MAALACVVALLTCAPGAQAAATIPVHTLETSDIPSVYRTFTLDTGGVPMSQASFDDGWATSKDQAGGVLYWPTRQGATATLPHVGDWDGGQVDLRLSLVAYNGGFIGQRCRFAADGKTILGDGLFWIHTNYTDAAPKATEDGLGRVDRSKRVGCTWKATFVRPDGTALPASFRGVTGFNDLDGWDKDPSMPFEGVQLGAGFDGAYLVKNAELVEYGTNGFAGAVRDAGDETDPDGARQVRHRLSATWSGPSFTFAYDLRNPDGRTDGCYMTFGAPVSLAYPLTYDPNGGAGRLPGD